MTVENEAADTVMTLEDEAAEIVMTLEDETADFDSPQPSQLSCPILLFIILLVCLSAVCPCPCLSRFCLFFGSFSHLLIYPLLLNPTCIPNLFLFFPFSFFCLSTSFSFSSTILSRLLSHYQHILFQQLTHTFNFSLDTLRIMRFIHNNISTETFHITNMLT